MMGLEQVEYGTRMVMDSGLMVTIAGVIIVFIVSVFALVIWSARGLIISQHRILEAGEERRSADSKLTEAAVEHLVQRIVRGGTNGDPSLVEIQNSVRALEPRIERVEIGLTKLDHALLSHISNIDPIKPECEERFTQLSQALNELARREIDREKIDGKAST